MTKRFMFQFLALFCTLILFSTFAVAESWVVIKDKKGECEVVAAQGKTTGIIAGPFKTKEEAKNAQNKECPMEENPTKTLGSYYETPVLYFNEPGPRDTGQVLECVRRRAQELNVKVVLLASVSGNTALKARQLLDPEIRIIAVSHVTGFVKPNHQEMPAEVREELISKGISVLTAQHAFGGVGRGIRNQLGSQSIHGPSGENRDLQENGVIPTTSIRDKTTAMALPNPSIFRLTGNLQGCSHHLFCHKLVHY
ncbi:MAG: hypothetical protein ACLPVO_17070 [Desulfomonilaceae bacterium]